jgi:hypothetical protein
MKQVPLTQGKVALVDDEDYDRVMQYSWHAYKQADKHVWYARTNTPRPNRRTLLLHRFIIDPAPTVLVDHKDFDGLNNQRDNLRAATRQESNMHRRWGLYTGVSRNGNGWQAVVTRDYKPVYLGTFPTAREAALAYDAMALKLHGEYAILNFEG